MRSLLIATLLILSTACAASDHTPAETTVRLIVGFQDQTDATQPQWIERLQQALDGKVTYLRETGGNAAVYRLTTSLDTKTLKQRLDALGGQGSIRYAELDQRRYIQKSSAGGK